MYNVSMCNRDKCETLQTHWGGLAGALSKVLLLCGWHSMGRGRGESEMVMGQGETIGGGRANERVAHRFS